MGLSSNVRQDECTLKVDSSTDIGENAGGDGDGAEGAEDSSVSVEITVQCQILPGVLGSAHVIVLQDSWLIDLSLCFRWLGFTPE